MPTWGISEPPRSRGVGSAVVLPALLLNYFGQGALLLADPEAVRSPFFLLAPDWAIYPLVGLATLATVIASQALISGVFSLTHQAIQLGFTPRMEVRHTSAAAHGQVYLPVVNWALAGRVCRVGVGLWQFGQPRRCLRDRGHGHDDHHQPDDRSLRGRALGMESLEAGRSDRGVPRHRSDVPGGQPHQDSPWRLVHPGGGDAGLLRDDDLAHGKAPVVLQAQASPSAHEGDDREPRREARFPASRAPAVYLFPNPGHVPPAFLANLRHNQAVHESVVFLSVVTTSDMPRVPRARRDDVTHLGSRFYQVILQYGFMEEPDVPTELRHLIAEVAFDPLHTTYFLGKEHVISNPVEGINGFRERLFNFMHRNARSAADYFKLPVDRVIEIGIPVEI